MNKFPRSGFMPQDVEPRWNFWGNTKRGAAVQNDQAPEVGMEIVSEATVIDQNNYVGMQCAIGALNEGQDYFVSYIVKARLLDWVFIRDNTNTATKSHRTFFNIREMAIGNIDPDHRNPMIQDLGNGIVRVGVAFTPTDLDTVSQNEMVIGITGANGENTTDAVIDEVLAEIYHAQIEEGNFPTAPMVKFPEQGR